MRTIGELQASLAPSFQTSCMYVPQVSQSASDIERAHRASVQYKYRLLVVSAALFFVALGVLGWVFVRRG